MKKNGETSKRDKPKGVKKDDPAQSQRFVETARKLETDVSGKSFERALDGLKSDKVSTGSSG
jgi:hypothetical protein